jgi:putative glutamine amidotransferase
MRIALPIPTSTDEPYNQRAIPAYESAIRRSGGEPVIISLTASPAEIRRIAATCHGVCLPGSPADVDPALYGAEPDPATAPADPARDAADRLLLEDAEAHGKPVLGICYGLQSLNVWRGGSLVQDITPIPVNHSAGSNVAIAHTALIAPNSILASLCHSLEIIENKQFSGSQASSRPKAAPSAAVAERPAVGTTTDPLHDTTFLRLPINTSHHQSVAAPGTGLRIVARCPDDGVIEALELDPEHELFHVEHPQFLLGIQWHPERSYDISQTSRNLFSRLVEEAKKGVKSSE